MILGFTNEGRWLLEALLNWYAYSIWD